MSNNAGAPTLGQGYARLWPPLAKSGGWRFSRDRKPVSCSSLPKNCFSEPSTRYTNGSRLSNNPQRALVPISMVGETSFGSDRDPHRCIFLVYNGYRHWQPQAAALIVLS
jgi:hypothetical protein